MLQTRLVERGLRLEQGLPGRHPQRVNRGANQEMTWGFFENYADEVFAFVDNKNSKVSTLDVKTLDGYLHQFWYVFS